MDHEPREVLMSRHAHANAETTRTRLLAAAKAELLAHGFEGASVRRLCTAAGYTTGALYFFFEDKEAVLREVVRPATSAILEATTLPSEDGPRDSDGVELRVRRLAKAVSTHRDATRILLANQQRPTFESFSQQLDEVLLEQLGLLAERAEPALAQSQVLGQPFAHWLTLCCTDRLIPAFLSSADERDVARLAAQLSRTAKARLNSLLDLARHWAA